MAAITKWSATAGRDKPWQSKGLHGGAGQAVAIKGLHGGAGQAAARPAAGLAAAAQQQRLAQALLGGGRAGEPAQGQPTSWGG